MLLPMRIATFTAAVDVTEDVNPGYAAWGFAAFTASLLLTLTDPAVLVAALRAYEDLHRG